MKFATALSLFAVSSAIRIETNELDGKVQSALELKPAEFDEQALKCIGEEVKRLEAEIEAAEGWSEEEAAAWEQGITEDIAAGFDGTIGALVAKDLEPLASGDLGMTEEEEEAALTESFNRVMACLGISDEDDGDDSEESE